MQNLVKRLTAYVGLRPALRGTRAAIVLGPLVATIGGLVAPSAHAQSAGDFQTITTINGPPRAQQAPQRRGGDPTQRDERVREADPAPFTTEVVRTVPTRGGATDDADGAPDAGLARFDPTADPDADTNARQARQPLDGDFSSPVDDDVPVDGDFTLLRPTQPIDGADPTSNDTRDGDERALFEAPGLQRDPTLFSIDVSPVLTERPRALFRFEPYTPLGVRVGSMIVLPSIETSLRTDSNVFQSDPAERDVAIEIVPTVVAVSNWNVHAIELRASGVFSKFREFDSEDAREYALEARGRLDLRRRTNIEGLILRSVTQESRSALDADPVTAGRADVTTTTGALTFNHRFNRLRLQLRGSVSEEDTSDVTSSIGGTLSNDDRDELTYAGAVRASWEFKPTLFAFAEFGLNRRTFGAVSNDDGLSRDSRGERYTVGVSFGTTDQILRGEVSIGYGEQRADETALTTLRGLILDANLAWRMNALTSLLLTASTDFEATTSGGTVGALTRSVGAEIRHAFRENIVANAGLSYSVDDFAGIDLVEREFRTNTGVEWFLNRHASVFSRYSYTNFFSDAPGRDYDDHEFRVGFRLAR